MLWKSGLRVSERQTAWILDRKLVKRTRERERGGRSITTTQAKVRQVEDRGNETHIGQSQEHSYQRRTEMEHIPTGVSNEKEEQASWALDRSSLWQMSWKCNVARFFKHLNYAESDREERELVEVIYLRGHVMPKAEPSADHWDWLICM